MKRAGAEEAPWRAQRKRIKLPQPGEADQVIANDLWLVCGIVIYCIFDVLL